MIIDQLFTQPIFEAADPNKLIVSVTILPMSAEDDTEVKDFDLTGRFQGDARSQINQATAYLKKFLESRGINFTLFQATYQGQIVNQQNYGSMEPQNDAERELQTMANQMRNKHPAVKENASDPITQFASNAHEEWRRNFDPTGTKPRIKKNSDGTEGDINVPFEKLHPDWKKENLAAGHAAHHAVKHFGRDMEKAAEHVHNEWMKRNPKADYNAAQHVPYDDLSDDEKEKDRVHVRTMMRLMGHQLNEFAPSGDDGEGPDQEELLRRLAAHWWNGNEHQMTRVEHTLAAMGWEIGEDDGYDEGGVFVVRPGDEHGRSYLSWPHEELDMNETAPPGAKAERMVKHIKAGYAKDGKLTPKEKGIAFATAWKAHNAGQVEEQGMAEAAQGHTIEAHGVRGMDRRTWHKTFRNTDQMMAWAEKHDAEIIGTRDLEQAQHHNLSPARQDMAEGVAETVSMDQAKKVLRHYGADHFKTTSNELHFYKNGRPMSVDLIFNDDATRSVNLSQLNSATRRLKGQGVAKGPQIDEMFADQGSGSTDRDNADYMKRRNAAKKAGYTGRETKAGTWRVFKDGNAVAAAGPFKSADEASAWIKKHKQGVTEMDKSEPSAGRDTGPRSGPDREAKPITTKKATRDAADMLNRAVRDSHKKKDVKEGDLEQTKTGIRHRGHRYGSGEELPNGGGNRSGFPNPGKYARDLDHLDKNLTSKLDHSMDVSWPHGNKKRDMDEGIVDRAAGVSLKLATPELLKMAGFIKAYIKAEAPDALPAMEEILQRLRFYSTQETGNYNIGALQNLHQLAMSIKSHLRPDSEVAPFLTEFIRIVKWYLDETIKLVNENNDPLMNKLRRALVQEGRVKELADDLKTMSDADFMKKYGKAKAAIRADMKRVDEAGISRLGKKDIEPEFDFRTGLGGDDETGYETQNEPELGMFRMGKPVEPNDAATKEFMAALTPSQQDNRFTAPAGWRYVEKDEDPARYGSDTTISGTGTPDWRSIAAAGKPAAASGLPKMRFDIASQRLVPVDQPVALDMSPKIKDIKSGSNPNIDADTRARALAWAAQQNAPAAAAKQKVDWKTIYALNKATIGSNPDIIKPRMQLNMPNGTIYLVQPGDTLTKIAAKQNQVNELSTEKLAQYKTAAARDARQADQEGDVKRGDKRFSGIVKATKKQFDNDAKKVDESRAARRALMAKIVNGN